MIHIGNIMKAEIVINGKRLQPASDDDRWQAVIKKDGRSDGQFWYAVKTTGVYCRPSCPSRQPKRENVEFFTTTEDAEKSGFRPCKRCDPKGAGLAGRHAEAVATGCRLIEQAEEFPNLGQIAKAVKMSPGYFHRLFKATTGLTPK